MRFLSIAVLFILTLSCGEGTTKKFHKAASKTEFSKFVNQKPLPKNPNLSLDKTIINADYPIEIALYKDGKFYYDLPNLGDGTGTWQFFGGRIVLKASRAIFDMHIDIYGKDDKMDNVIIKFSDRFGPKVLETENHNFL